MVLTINLFYQLARFGVIGLLAAAVHFFILICLVEGAGMLPLKANIIAFLFGFQISYWGHRQWTFKGTAVRHRIALPKLLCVGSLNFIANEALFSFFLISLKLPYPVALFFALAVLPIVNFTVGKFWVFR